jgi:hypothetical protein
MLGVLAKASSSSSEARAQWASNQRALARALGISLEDWMGALDAAAARSTGLTAAVVGAAMAKGLGLSVLEGLDGVRLAALARELIDPRPPRVTSPLLKEAIRRADDLGGPRGGARLLKRAAQREAIPTPQRDAKPLGSSVDVATPDAPGSVRADELPLPKHVLIRQQMAEDTNTTGISVTDSSVASDVEDLKSGDPKKKGGGG